MKRKGTNSKKARELRASWEKLKNAHTTFLIREGSFPRPVRLGVRAVGWIEAEVSAWLMQKADLRSTSARS